MGYKRWDGPLPLARRWEKPHMKLNLKALAVGAALATGAALVPAMNAMAAAPAVDAKAVMTSNNCFTCHGVTSKDAKKLGPNYAAVAAKYKGKPNAAALISASIKAGSTGKWGQMPMPPYAALTPAQLAAISKFVLAQK